MEKELRQLLEREKPRVYDSVNRLFDVSPSEPILYIGRDSDMLSSTRLGMQMTTKRATIPSVYSEEDRKIAIDPSSVIELCKQRRKYRINLHPKFQAVRNLVKEYAHHCISFLHNFQTNSQIGLDWWAQVEPTDSDKSLDKFTYFVKIALPIAKFEGMGYCAVLKIAKEFEHRDEYWWNFSINKKESKRVVQRFISGQEALSLLHFPQHIGIALSYWLATEYWDNIRIQDFRKLARTPLNHLNNEEITKSIQYLRGEILETT